MDARSSVHLVILAALALACGSQPVGLTAQAGSTFGLAITGELTEGTRLGFGATYGGETVYDDQRGHLQVVLKDPGSGQEYPLTTRFVTRVFPDPSSQVGLNNEVEPDDQEDFDQDGASNADEIAAGTSPTDPDTDGDGLVDGEDDDPLAHAGTQVVYVHTDLLGSAAVVTDANGGVTRRVAYGVFGEIRSNLRLGPAGTPDTAHKYTGKRFDPNVALADYSARWYDPQLAIFTQPDPMIADPFDPQGLNRFAYVQGDPLNLVDPTGHFSLGGFFGGVGRGIGGAWGGIKSAASWAWGGVRSAFGALGRGVSWGLGQLRSFSNFMMRETTRAVRWGMAQAARASQAFQRTLRTFGAGVRAIANHPRTQTITSYAGRMLRGEGIEMGGGIAGTVGGILGGLALIGIGAAVLNPGFVGAGVKSIGAAVSMPRSGSHTGLLYPGTPGGASHIPASDTKLHHASVWHDDYVGRHGYWNSSAQFGWIARAWTGEGVELGPWGQSIRLVGTIGFGLVGGVQWLTGN